MRWIRCGLSWVLLLHCEPTYAGRLHGAIGFSVELLSGECGANIVDTSFIRVASWVAGSRGKGVKRTVILGEWRERPIAVCKNVLIRHLSTPVSPSAGRRMFKIVLNRFKSVVHSLLLLCEHLNGSTEIIIAGIKFGKGVFEIHVEIFKFCVD